MKVVIELYPIIATCGRVGVDPAAYVADVLSKLARPPTHHEYGLQRNFGAQIDTQYIEE